MTSIQINQELALLWHLRDISPLSSDSAVFKAYQVSHQREVVVKLARSIKEFNQEVLALTYYQGAASVELYASDKIHMALLMEYVNPGTNLKSLFPDHDTAAVKIAAELIQRLHQIPHLCDASFPRLSDWLKVFDHERNHVLPHYHLEHARMLGAELLASTEQEILLHADLHHQNILLSDRAQYIAIDPHGVIGDPVFEVATFMRNPLPEITNTSNLKKILAARLELFSTLLGFDIERLRAWSYVGAILAAAWSLEDHQPYDAQLTLAELFLS